MGLDINYLSKEDGDMAEETTAKVRVYRTVDGQLVGEGDPRGAFLAYAPGQPVPAGEVDAYNDVVDREHGLSKAERAQRGDDEARAELRDLQSGEKRRNPTEPPVLMHDRLATELADEARTLANRGPDAYADAVDAVDDDRTVARFPVYRTETGDLVHEGHPDAFALAYAPGDTVADGDLEQFNDLGDPPAREDDGQTPSDTTETPAETPAKKATGRAARRS